MAAAASRVAAVALRCRRALDGQEVAAALLSEADWESCEGVRLFFEATLSYLTLGFST